ncbi:hypothetical protein [Oerskovia turbata]
MTSTTQETRPVADPATATDGTTAPDPVTATDSEDVRDQIEAGVLFANGRLAGRRFASLAEAEAWAHPELGDQVVEFNPVCDCSV